MTCTRFFLVRKPGFFGFFGFGFRLGYENPNMYQKPAIPVYADVIKRWRKKPIMLAFADYFENTWINSAFKKWQLLWTEPGKEHTNSPIESYNKEIKSSFTKRIKHHIKR